MVGIWKIDAHPSSQALVLAVGFAFMEGPFSLSEQEVTKRVPRGKPGVYVTGYFSLQFLPDRWGRSDTDLYERIHARIGDAPMFKFKVCADADEAYEEECALFHEHHKEGDTRHAHPTKPEGSARACPKCGA